MLPALVGSPGNETAALAHPFFVFFFNPHFSFTPMRFATLTAAFALTLSSISLASAAFAGTPGSGHIDAPATVTTVAAVATTSAVFSKNAELGQFNRLLLTAGLKHLLKRPTASYTVFAPTNAAVAKVPSRISQRLFRADAPGLRHLVRTHLVAGTLDLTQLADGAEIRTLTGEVMRLAKGPNGEMLLNGVYRVGQPQFTANGVVYPLESMIAPTR